MKINKAISALGSDSTSLFALIGMLALIVFYIYISRTKITTKMLVNTAMLVALAAILHQIKIYHMPQGGSVTAASMVPLLLIAFAYGPGMGMLGGFIFGIINFLTSPYIVHPVQVLFDYPLPFMAMGLAGYFKDKFMIGAVVAMALRLLCHFISGLVFFASYAPTGMNPAVYSLVFNGSYIIPNLLITLLVLGLLPTKKFVHTMQVKAKLK